jgi:2-hydroxychromene-2-carboxylate isomerase
MTERIEFYFDFRNPYAYLAHHRLERIAARFGCAIDYRPLDRTSVPSSPSQVAYLRTDVRRWAERYGIALETPKGHDSARLNLATLFAAARGRAGDYVREAFHATWGLGGDPADEALLEGLAAKLGWDARELRDWLRSPETSRRYDAVEREAHERGIFGVPIACLRDEMWWGNDRLDFLEERLARLARRGRPPVSDERVALGAAIFGFVEPHRGAESAFNRWYERDHLIAAGAMAPWTIATQRWVATRELKALRYPAPSPITGPSLERGSYLSAIWIQADRYDDQQTWVSEQIKVIASAGRNFDARDVVTTAGYDYRGGAFRDADGVPPELALDRRYPGVVLAWLTRAQDVALADFEARLLRDSLPALLARSAVAMALVFAPRSKAPWWP